LSAVVTDPARRGEGHGGTLVGAARDLIAEGGADLGIFTCDRDLRGFYERAGWTFLPGTVVVGGTREAPFPSDRIGKIVLAAFFSPKANANREAFVGSRVELYPGSIDTLW
jgi:GNAT superfamily N-acetyltransferase